MGRKESVYDTDIIRSVMLCTIILNDTACLRSALRVFTAVKIPFFLCKPSVNGPFTFPVLIDLGVQREMKDLVLRNVVACYSNIMDTSDYSIRVTLLILMNEIHHNMTVTFHRVTRPSSRNNHSKLN